MQFGMTLNLAKNFINVLNDNRNMYKDDDIETILKNYHECPTTFFCLIRAAHER